MRSFFPMVFLIAATALCLGSNAHASAALAFKTDSRNNVLTVDNLLKRADASRITIAADSTYKKDMQYQAVPLAALLKEQGISATDTLNFIALDGFIAPLPAALIVNAKKSRAWLAIEPADHAWPALSSTNKASAGPFYLVWTDPQADGISPEQWPYQIARIEKVEPIEKRFPMLSPAAKVPAGSSIRNGFTVFQKNCMPCHKLNGGGDSSVGPDLNIPHNPTEYFQIDFLKKLIRNPKQVRSWPDSKMPAFDDKAISDQELDALIDYLKHMKK